MAKALEGWECKIGEAVVELERAEVAAPHPPTSRFVFHAYSPDSCGLRFVVTDFCSTTWECIRTVSQLEDLRDVIGIGGSWSDFVIYLAASLSSGNVKLVLRGALDSFGTSARLVFHKSKGMPLVSIPLSMLRDSSPDDAKKNLSLELLEDYKRKCSDLVREQERCCELTKLLDAEREKNEIIQSQLDAVVFSSKRKQQKLKASDKAFSLPSALSNLDKVAIPGSQQSIDLPSKDVHSTKASNRVVPAYRRAKVRGAILQDDEANDNL